jgi:hypothetical protein
MLSSAASSYSSPETWGITATPQTSAPHTDHSPPPTTGVIGFISISQAKPVFNRFWPANPDVFLPTIEVLM